MQGEAVRALRCRPSSPQIHPSLIDEAPEQSRPPVRCPPHGASTQHEGRSLATWVDDMRAVLDALDLRSEGPGVGGRRAVCAGRGGARVGSRRVPLAGRPVVRRRDQGGRSDLAVGGGRLQGRARPNGRPADPAPRPRSGRPARRDPRADAGAGSPDRAGHARPLLERPRVVASTTTRRSRSCSRSARRDRSGWASTRSSRSSRRSATIGARTRRSWHRSSAPLRGRSPSSPGSRSGGASSKRPSPRCARRRRARA